LSKNNTSSDEQLLRERSLAFFGAVVASVSHELNNVISIVDQSSGLLEDFALMSERGKTPPPEKLRLVADRVGRQTQRGLEIIQRLNTFAHSPDYPKNECNIVDVVRNITALSERLADLKKVKLEISLPDRELQMLIDPFSFQHLFFSIIRRMLDCSESGEQISVSVVEEGGECIVIIESTIAKYEYKSDELDILLSGLVPVRLISDSGGGTTTITLALGDGTA